METFEQWLQRTGQDTRNVGAKVLAKAAWEAAKAQSRNYVADDEVLPERVTFANGRVVTIQDNPNPNVHNGVYLAVDQLPE
jgi:hypothetical protein